MRHAALAILLALPGAAGAFEVRLGDRPIGSLDLSRTGETVTLSARFQGTPLAVADGAFEASSGPASAASGAVVRQYLSRSAFTTESRTVSILFDGERVVETTIDPASDRTAASEPGAVPAGVLDLARGMERLVAGGGCPAGIVLYDGRRVAQVDTGAVEAVEGGTLCRASYRIVQGPGLLSPIGITEVRLDVLLGPDGAFLSMEASAGPFAATLAR